MKLPRRAFFLRFASRLMVTYVCILLIAVVTVVALSSRLIADYLERRTMEMNARLLSTFTRTVDTLILGGIDDLASKIAQERTTNPDIARYFDGPLAGHVVDLMKVDRYLETLKSVSPSVYSVGIYYAANDLLVSTECIRHTLYQSAGLQPDFLYFRTLVGEASAAPWGMPLWVFDPVYDSHALSSPVRMVPRAAFHLVRLIRDGAVGKMAGAVIVTVREDLLAKILQDAAPEDLNRVMILDGHGIVVSHPDKSLLGRPIGGLAFADRIDAAAVGESFTTRYDGKPCVVSMSRSAVTGWTLVAVTPSDRIADVTAFIWKRGILIAVFAVVIGAAISFLAARRLASPLERLVRFCQAVVQGRVPQSRNELVYLESAITDLTEARDGHERKFRDSLPALRSTFALDLLSDEVPDEAEVRVRMELIGLHFHGPGWTVFAAVPAMSRRDGTRESLPSLKTVEMAKLDLRHAVEQALAGSGIGIVSCEKDGVVAFLANYHGLYDDAVDAFRMALDDPGSTVGWRGAAGTAVVSPGGLRGSHLNALAALRVRYFMPDRDFFTAEDAGRGTETADRRAGTPESLLAFQRAIRAADGKAAVPALRRFIGDLTGMRCGYDRSVELLSEAVSVVEDFLFSRGLRFSDLDPHARGLDLRGRAGRCGDVVEFGDWFETVVGRAFESRGPAAARGAGLARMAREFVEKNLGNRQLSLDFTADALAVSPSHLSRIFKQESGLNFVDFVGERKLERAREMIGATRWKVEDIADAVGYTTAQYLITKFKKRFGCTPLEYRRIHAAVTDPADGVSREARA